MDEVELTDVGKRGVQARAHISEVMVEQTDIEPWVDKLLEHPESVLIIIVSWFLIMYVVKEILGIRVTPWIALMCFALAILIGLACVSAFLV